MCVVSFLVWPLLLEIVVLFRVAEDIIVAMPEVEAEGRRSGRIKTAVAKSPTHHNILYKRWGYTDNFLAAWSGRGLSSYLQAVRACILYGVYRRNLFYFSLGCDWRVGNFTKWRHVMVNILRKCVREHMNGWKANQNVSAASAIIRRRSRVICVKISTSRIDPFLNYVGSLWLDSWNWSVNTSNLSKVIAGCRASFYWSRNDHSASPLVRRSAKTDTSAILWMSLWFEDGGWSDDESRVHDVHYWISGLESLRRVGGGKWHVFIWNLQSSRPLLPDKCQTPDTTSLPEG